MASNVLDEFLILFRTRLTGDGIQKVNKQLGQTKNQLFATRNLFKTFFAYDLYGAFSQLIPNLIQTTQQLGAMESRFNAVTGSAKTGKDELKFVSDESERLGLNFLKTAENYSIFYATVRNTQGQKATRDIFTQWSEAFRVLHIDPERQGRILYALREMSSKGKIYMSDLAVQLGSAVPDALPLAAKAMGYFGKNALQRFREDVRDNKIDVNEFLKAFSKMVNVTYVSADKLAFAMNKPDAQLQLLAKHWQDFQIAFSEAGFEKDLVSTLKLMNSGLKSLSKNAKPLYGLIKLALQLFVMGKSLSFLNKVGKFLIGAKEFIIFSESVLGAIKLILWDIGGKIKYFWSFFNFFGKLGFWGMIISGLLMISSYILKNFYPEIWTSLGNYWYSFYYGVRADLASLMELPFLRDIDKFNDTMNKINQRNLNVKNLSSDMIVKMYQTRGGASKPSIINPRIDITNNIDVPNSKTSAQEIGDYLNKSQEIAMQNALHNPYQLPKIKNSW